MSLIEAQQLTRSFRIPDKGPGFAAAVRHLVRPRFMERTAVDRIDLRVEAGESVAYVGPNGAGKSTTLKMLTGILAPTSGQVRVRGLDPHRDRIANARHIGVVFGQRSQLWWDLPVFESLRLLGDIYDVPQADFTRNLGELSELLELGELLRVPARQLSLGQRMRCEVAAALLHGPDLVYLDEPTLGLDVAVKDNVRRFIRHINRERGVTVMLTSHDLGDIEDLCERMVMIDGGRIIFDGPLRTMRERFGKDCAIHLSLRGQLPDALEVARKTLPELPAACSSQPEPHELVVQFDMTQVPVGPLVGRLLAALPVQDLRIQESSIESILRELYKSRPKPQDAQP
ncbi:ABC transporter ATP-binding protein [Archangium violaceum]|uniref:Sugar ABC transporter ATP-binding protein n=1 Tax=Archangium violaceum Cb vi76 TaxID=1406225 RepID=A0A084SW88_9BACT|nr:ATP-binding cassette domain-containing protein [Archangium violaceum]KFA92723.1 sugar ABC transporter ATP-binding protein [Archangium violaceum Cb vi76]